MRALFVLVLAVACQSTLPSRHAVPHPSGELVLPGSSVSMAVNEYFHLRKLAIMAGDVEILWSRFPQLRTGEDLPRGVNVEARRARYADGARSLADVIFDLDRYERMRVTVEGDEAVVRVHGLERYVEQDFSDGSAGEFVIDLYLRRDSERWSVVRTDEMTIGEYHEQRQR